MAGPRIPVTLPQQPFGTTNPVPVTRGGRVPQPLPIKLQGPAQGKEQFNHPDIPAAVTRQLNALQQNVNQATAQAKASPFADGNLLPGCSFTNGQSLTLDHKLGRAFRGFWLVTPRFPASAGVAVVLLSATQPAPDRQIVLFSDGTFFSDVWVF